MFPPPLGVEIVGLMPVGSYIRPAFGFGSISVPKRFPICFISIIDHICIGLVECAVIRSGTKGTGDIRKLRRDALGFPGLYRLLFFCYNSGILEVVKAFGISCL